MNASSKLNLFKGERLRQGRLYRAKTLTDLAKDTGLSKQSLSQYEHGQSSPNAVKLFVIANALDLPFSFFTKESFSLEASEAVYFRSFTSARKRDRVAQNYRLQLLAKSYKALSSFVDFPDNHLPNYSFETLSDEEMGLEKIELISSQVRDQWGLGREPIKNLRWVLEKNGIIVCTTGIDSSRIDAYSQRIYINSIEKCFIVLSDASSIARAEFDMAHELAHIILHPWSEDLETLSKDELKLREKQANSFAGSFLLPVDSFYQDIKKYPIDLDHYCYLKSKWNVSVAAMVYRAKQIGCITYNQYTNLMRKISKLGWRIKEPGDLLYDSFGSILQNAVQIMMEDGGYAPDFIVSLLEDEGVCLDVAEIESLLGLEAGTLLYTTMSEQQDLSLRTALA